MEHELIQQRKGDHLRIVTQEDVSHTQSTLLECVQLEHNALPELNLANVNLSTEFFGKQLAAPLMITSMTGGEAAGARLNQDLAMVAGRLGLAFAVGSQRVMLRHPERQADFAVREALGPNGVLLSNIGAQQLREYPPEQLVTLVTEIDADGLCVHLNVAHELAQAEGDRNFSELLPAIGRLCALLPGKVLVKETGAGLSRDVVARLLQVGVPYLDVAGAGGTSWTKVEAHRGDDPEAQAIAETFADWGIPTAVSTLTAHKTVHALGSNTCIVASGGILTGLDAARTLALGADLVGIARGVLLAWQVSGCLGAEQYLVRVCHELRVACVLTGAENIPALLNVPRVYTGRLADWLAASNARPTGVVND